MPFVPDEIVSAAKLNLGTAKAGAREDNLRSFTNTGFLDLDALTGGSGTISAVSVSVTTGATALVMIGARVQNDTAGAITVVGYKVSGASTLAASDNTAFNYTSYVANASHSASKTIYETGLTPGVNVFEVQARVTGNLGTISRVHLVVMAVPA